MIKRILASVCAIMILAAIPVAVYADNYLGESGALATTQITYHQDSSYMIVIPSTIDANMEYTFAADYVDIGENEIVKVYCDAIANGGIPLTNSYGHTFNLTFSGADNACVAEFTRGQVTSDITILGIPSPGSEPRAGDYTGTAEFYVMIEYNGN